MKSLSFSFVSVVLLALASSSFAQNSDQSVLEMADLGLAMNHPKAWQVSTVKKSNDVRVLIPIEGSSQKALLELFNIPFNSEKEIWQLSQKGINDRMKRDIMRQWEEEFLGVPMLMTKASYSDKEGPHILLTGLIYSRTPKKLMFRLTAAPDDYDKAEFVWRETMNTIRTGRAWLPEDPSLKPDPKAPKTTQLPPPVIKAPKSLDGEIKVTKPPIAISTTVAGRKIELRIPGEWSGKVQEDGTILLSHTDLTSTIQVTLASSLDSDPWQRALMAASSKTLADFQKVTKRDETTPAKNRAGANVSSVWRTGIDAKGDLFSCDAAVVNGDFYVVIAFRSTNASKIGAERKLVESLLNLTTVDQIP